VLEDRGWNTAVGRWYILRTVAGPLSQKLVAVRISLEVQNQARAHHDLQSRDKETSPLPEFFRQRARAALAFAILLAAAVPAFPAASLQPTRAGLVRQSLGAREAGFTYLQNDGDVHDYVRKGLLVTLRGNGDYHIDDDVRHTAARPEVKVFVERLAKQYRDACGEKLVVTSLVRPRNRQPWNSDPLSVHPTGMAVDLRISVKSSCRRWLESTLLELEGDGLIEGARERVVPHYHVVVFPAYARHLERNGIALPAAGGVMLAGLPPLGAAGMPAAMTAVTRDLPTPMMPVAVLASTTTPGVRTVTNTAPARPTTSAGKGTSTRRPSTTTHKPNARRYKVRSGDNLWTIARRHGVSVQAIRKVNKVSSTRLRPGQVLAIPAR
jgi:hypothetical protein